MRVLQAERPLPYLLTRLREGERAALLDQLGQVCALDVLQGQIMPPHPPSVDSGMVKPAEDFDLAVKTAHYFGVAQQFLVNELQRDDAGPSSGAGP